MDVDAARDFLRITGRGYDLAELADLDWRSDEQKAFQRSMERFYRGEFATISSRNADRLIDAADGTEVEITAAVVLPRNSNPKKQTKADFQPRNITITADGQTAIRDGYLAAFQEALEAEIGGDIDGLGGYIVSANLTAADVDWLI